MTATLKELLREFIKREESTWEMVNILDYLESYESISKRVEKVREEGMETTWYRQKQHEYFTILRDALQDKGYYYNPQDLIE